MTHRHFAWALVCIIAFALRRYLPMDDVTWYQREIVLFLALLALVALAALIGLGIYAAGLLLGWLMEFRIVRSHGERRT